MQVQAYVCESGRALAGLGLCLQVWAYICRFALLLASLSLSSQVWANFCRSGLISPCHLVLYPHVQAYICRLRLIFLFAFAHLACICESGLVFAGRRLYL